MVPLQHVRRLRATASPSATAKAAATSFFFVSSSSAGTGRVRRRGGRSQGSFLCSLSCSLLVALLVVVVLESPPDLPPHAAHGHEALVLAFKMPPLHHKSAARSTKRTTHIRETNTVLHACTHKRSGEVREDTPNKCTIWCTHSQTTRYVPCFSAACAFGVTSASASTIRRSAIPRRGTAPRAALSGRQFACVDTHSKGV